ncbi:MAG TPA: oxidoreductase, partial [Porphyromonadaceae bacterium]|nr:oxidoreductase [Porphyromonadaceae bacterium]
MQNIAILGLGEGRSAISAVLTSSRLNLVNICDRNEDLCIQRAEEFNLRTYTTDYEELLDNPDIDIIAIYTPDNLHATHVKQALAKGKHVVCTKPFIHDLSLAKELTELAETQQRKVFVGQSSRFFEPMKRQRADFEEGVIGDL